MDRQITTHAIDTRNINDKIQCECVEKTFIYQIMFYSVSVNFMMTSGILLWFYYMIEKTLNGWRQMRTGVI